ncbi:MAG: glycoside hydrolase family 10 protein [Leptolyngbyaceae cyanobacterium]
MTQAATTVLPPEALLSAETIVEPAIDTELAQADGLVAPSCGGNVLPTDFNDPADQIAPPGLNIQPGDAPIRSYQAIAMRQELEHLMGRFESALIAAEAIALPSELPNEVAPQPAALDPVLQSARDLYDEWPQLIEQQAYGEARSRWLTTRQNLWQNFPLDRPQGQPEIRAIWLDRGTIVRAGSEQRLEAIFDQLSAAGINTVFLETVNASYPIYPSRIAPTQNPLTRRWDPLEAAVELAHERDMEVHAWLWVFAAGNQLHNALLNLPNDYLGPVLNGQPDWAAYDNRGNRIPRGQTKPFFDPAHPQVRSYLLRVVNEIITQYDVDGIHLDYIRYPFQDPSADRTYGYGRVAREVFEAIAGVDPLNLSPRVDFLQPRTAQQQQRDQWERWTDFRIQQVTSFVAETRQLIQRTRPELVLSTAVFAQPEHERQQKIQQDWGDWAERGLVDWIVLMSYAQDTNRFEELIHPWVIENDYRPTLVIPGIRLLNLSEAAAIDQLQALRDVPAPGYALFAAANLLTQDLRETLAQTQGATDVPIPQADPFGAAAGRYAALQQEWRWLMANGQLWMSDDLLPAWVADANNLGQAIAALGTNPSRSEVDAVQAQLQDLRQRLGTGMDIQTVSRDYRLQTWENRLLTVERLVAYGEGQL